jgi:DNA-directed RNA polymerase subunit RPC12/RpoP
MSDITFKCRTCGEQVGISYQDTEWSCPSCNASGLTRKASTEQVAAFCVANDIPAVVVGSWVWSRFESKPDRAIRTLLLANGFTWVKRRIAWAHCCGTRSRRSNGRPEDKYGEEDVRKVA